MSVVRAIISDFLPLIEVENQLVATDIRIILESDDSDDIIMLKMNNLIDNALIQHSTSKKLCDYLNTHKSDINYFNNNQSPLLKLADETLLHIFSFFKNQTEAARVRGVSRRINSLAQDPLLLKTLPDEDKRLDYAKPLHSIRSN